MNDIPRPNPEDVYASYDAKRDNVYDKALNDDDIMSQAINDALDRKSDLTEFEDNIEVQEIIARFKEAREQLESELSAARKYSSDNLDTLIPEAQAEMDAEMMAREAAQNMPPRTPETPEAPATAEQASIIMSLPHRNFNPQDIKRTYLLPGGMLMLVSKAFAPVDDVVGGEYTYQIFMKSIEDYQSKADDNIRTYYYLNDNAIEQDIAIIPNKLVSPEPLSIEDLLAEFEKERKSQQDEWELERALGVHTVTMEEAETLAELLRQDWPAVSPDLSKRGATVPEITELPTRRDLNMIENMILDKLAEGGETTTYEKNDKKVRLRDTRMEGDASKRPELADKLGIYWGMEDSAAGDYVCLAVVESVDELDNGHTLEKQTVYYTQPPEYQIQYVEYDSEGNVVPPKGEPKFDDVDDVTTFNDVMNYHHQMREDDLAAGLIGFLTKEHIDMLKDLLS